MSFNKVNGKLDFRNVKFSQFDPGQIPKMTFSELQSSLRVYETTPILPDAYTHFIQTLDSEDRPTLVEYYQATDTAKDQITFVADVAKSLASTYFQVQRYQDKKTHGFYYVVDGEGIPPYKSDIETPINISENDPASVICFATKVTMDAVTDIIVTSKGYTSAYLEIEYLQFGETEAVNVATSGFSVARVKEGRSFKVSEVCLSYNDDGHPVYNGNLLKNFIFNPYTASFDVNSVTDPKLVREMAVLVNLKTLELLGIPLDDYVIADDEIVSTSDGTLIKADF